ncbi:Phosphatidylinositol 4-phosphate 5-kinase 5 [Linum perenne]
MGSQGKLTRSPSSFLRSSPTVRSSIHSLHSLSSMAEEDLTTPLRPPPPSEDDDGKEDRRRKKRCGSGLSRFTPVLTMVSIAFFSFFSLSFFLFFYLRRDEIPTSENLLLGLIFIAVTLFFASKNKSLINQNLNLIKQLWDENRRFRFRFCVFTSRTKSNRQVKWFIGESDSSISGKIRDEEKKVIREGVEFYSNGDYYEGEFHKGKCNGSGVYNFFVNGRYEGDWIDGRYDGYGIESWARGSRYRGQYRQGLRHGYGVYRFFTGDSYAGEWCNGQSHGFGVQTCADGSCYVGEFKCGVKHGLGVYHFRNGDRYGGEYFGDKIHGFGVYHFANGHCYEGSWHEGRKQGYGMYIFRNGDTRSGEWDGGLIKTPLSPQTDAVLRAVQAARKTAANAVKVRRVDEQVNRAVHAANRAATAARVAAVKAVQNRMDGKFCDTNV